MARLVMHAELAAEDVRVGRKRVARLMCKANIEGVHRRRRISTTRRDPAKRAAPDLVKRRFRTQGPDRIWAADITYVPTQAGFLYLAVVIDLWSRKVVGWSMRSDLTTPLVTDALDMAISQRKPNGVIFHSDQGQPNTAQPRSGTDAKKPGSYPPWDAEETRMTMPSPSRSSPPSKQNSSTATPTTPAHKHAPPSSTS